MSNKFVEKSPFTRVGTASHAIYMAMAKAGKPLTMAEIAKRAKVSFKKTELLVRSYMNPYHNAPMRRAGIAIVHEENGFKLAACKVEAKAKRPTRGTKKNAKAKKVKAASKAKSQPMRKPTKKVAAKKPTGRKTEAPPMPVPATEAASGVVAQ